ncbi:MAG: hypothetical protein V4641_13060 [Pseudomonadota bacterium]
MGIDLTLKSTAVTNREAVPRVLNNPGAGAASMRRHVQGYFASVTASLSATSVIRMCEIDAHAIVTDLTFASAAQTAGKFDIGVYRTNADGGAVVDQDFFASDVDCASAVVLTDVLNESTTNTLLKQTQPLWLAAGMTADPGPGTMLDLCLTVHTTDITTGTGAVILKAGYVL